MTGMQVEAVVVYRKQNLHFFLGGLSETIKFCQANRSSNAWDWKM